MTPLATVTVDPARRHGVIHEQVYGQFLEHIGRAIYGGVYEPGSPLADSDGYRLDVLEACRELAPPLLRWPGGNFASGYHWRDGIGSVDERPARRDLAWNAIEPNTFGTEEFLELVRRLGTEAYLNLNMSTGTLDEALGWLEYCNATEDLPEARLRRAGPHPGPHGVRTWGLGNENYGWWQHGHTTAESYAESAREWAKLLRWTDPDIQLVAVGSPEPDWNWTVLRQAGRFVDYLSLHFYWHGDERDMYSSTLAGPVGSERDIVAAYGMALAAQKADRLPKPLRIAVDEWGVWSRTMRSFEGAPQPDLHDLMVQGLSARSGIDTRFEEAYDLKDALAVASWLHVMWRHPEKVGLATQAQMVNVIAPIHVGPEGLVRHTIFWPLALARLHAGSVSLDVLVSTDTGIGAAGVAGVPGDALPALDAGATLDPVTGIVHLSLVNRLPDSELRVRIDGIAGTARRITLAGDDPYATNTLEAPDTIRPIEDKTELDGDLILPPHSHTTIVLEGRPTG